MTGLAQAAGAELDLLLADADRALARNYPGDRPGRQPVHTAYVPADQYGPDLPGRWGRQALQALQHAVPRATDIAAVMGLAPAQAADVRARVAGKLAAEPVEDLRLDFEDGYGDRGDAAEDADARTAAATLAAETAAGRTPPFIGLRCKSLEAGTRRRAIAHAGRLHRRAGRPRAAAGRVRGHAAQGHLARPGPGHVSALRPAGRGARAGRRPAPVRGAGRDPAADPGRRRRGHHRPLPARGRPGG